MKKGRFGILLKPVILVGFLLASTQGRRQWHREAVLTLPRYGLGFFYAVISEHSPLNRILYPLEICLSYNSRGQSPFQSL